MTPEQRKRASTAVVVPSAYGLGAGIWSVVLTPQPGDGPGVMYAMGLAFMMLTLLAAFVLNAIGLLLRAWIMDEPLQGPETPCWRRP